MPLRCPFFTVGEGRFISPFDEEHARNVAVIGNAIANSLFPQIDPIGKPVRLNGQLYEVIGVFEKDPGLFGCFGVDQFVCIPMSNFHENYPDVPKTFSFSRCATTPISIPCAIGWWKPCVAGRRRSRITRITISRSPIPTFHRSVEFSPRRHGLTHGGHRLHRIARWGIGVMNIMLISVDGAHGEIGIRQGNRRAQVGYSRRVSDGSRDAFRNRWRARHPDWRRHFDGRPRAGLHSRERLAVLGGHGRRYLGWGGPFLRMLSGQSRGQSRSHSVFAIRVAHFRGTELLQSRLTLITESLMSRVLHFTLVACAVVQASSPRCLPGFKR